MSHGFSALPVHALARPGTGHKPKTPPAAGSLGDRFYCPPHVVCARRGEVVALLDQRTGKYVTLDGVASRIWDCASTGLSSEDIIQQLASEYEVARERLEADVDFALGQFSAARLIARGPPPESPAQNGRASAEPLRPRKTQALRVPSVLRCGVVIFTLKLLLRAGSFERTLAWIRRRVTPLPPSARDDADVVSRTERAVAMAGAFYPGRARCLEQSLALYYLLRRQGAAVKYCQGVQFYPFQAHAWIEYEGAVVNDVGPHVKHFTRFPDQLP
jgi:transglutaminase superfamily protein/coenzyme PQQ synthesis protein D (PqqD)